MSTESVQPLPPLVALPEARGQKPVAPAEPKTSPTPAAQESKPTRPVIEQSSTVLNFHVDDGTGEMVLSVLDRESGRTLYQIPNEVALRIARHLAAGGHGLVDEIA